MLPVDDPFWATHTPPWSFNCRCSVIPLTERQGKQHIRRARERGRKVDEVPPGVRPPSRTWSYDRSKPTAPLEGLRRVVEQMASRCDSGLFAAHAPSDWFYCIGPGAAAFQPLAERARRSSSQILEDSLPTSMRGARYDELHDKLARKGALSHGYLSPPEAVALRMWSGDKASGLKPYQVIGETLRAMGRGKPAKDFARVQPIVWGSWKALGNLPASQAEVLYRGFKEAKLPRGVRDEFMALHTTAGSVVQYNGFTSFSSKLKVAREFSGKDGWVVVVRRPSQARDIQPYTALDGGEHLYAPMRQFIVVEVDRMAKRIEVQEIDSQARKALSKDHNFASSMANDGLPEGAEVIKRVKKGADSPDDVIQMPNGVQALRRVAEDQEHQAWFDEQVRKIDEARNGPPLTGKKKEAMELVADHMIYG